MKNSLGLAVNTIGTLIAVCGAITNALGIYRFAFAAWMVSNTLLLLLFWGVEKRWWDLNSGALIQCGLYGIYMVTSTAGFVRVSG